MAITGGLISKPMRIPVRIGVPVPARHDGEDITGRPRIEARLADQSPGLDRPVQPGQAQGRAAPIRAIDR